MIAVNFEKNIIFSLVTCSINMHFFHQGKLIKTSCYEVAWLKQTRVKNKPMCKAEGTRTKPSITLKTIRFESQ